MDIITPDFSGVIQVAPSAKPKQMMTVQRDGNQTYVLINSSSLSILQTCARKAFYALSERWKSRQTSPALIYGSAIHKALELFYTHPSRERTLPADLDDVAPLLAHGHSAPTKHFIYDAIAAFVVAADPLKMLPETDKRSVASGVWVLTHYFKTYLNDAYVIHTDAVGPVVERSFTCNLYDDAQLKIDLFGQIDFILRNEVTGEVLPGDHKTSSQLGYDFLNRIKPNHQYTGYLYGAQQTLGITGEHFLVNGIQVKARPVTTKAGPPTFTRQITRRSHRDIDEFRESVVEAVGNFLRWDARKSWPLGVVDACANYGGCQFLDVCGQPEALRSNILEAKFFRETAE